MLHQICDSISGVQAPFGNRIDITPVIVEGDISKELRELGAYGMIRGATAFIAGTAPLTPESLIDFGYVFEHALLKATDLGLGSCWVGGSLNRSSFASRINVREGASVVCVSPIGYPKEKQPFRDHLIRFAIRAAKRKQWNEMFFKGNFGVALEKKDVSGYELPLEMLRLAPSAANRQPWRVVIEESRIHFFITRSPIYQKILAQQKIPDLQLTDIGICMSHFFLSANKHGLRGTWEKCDVANISLPKCTEYIVSWIDKG